MSILFVVGKPISVPNRDPGHYVSTRENAIAFFLSPESLQFSGLREGVLGEYLVRVRVRTYVARELAVFWTAGGSTRGVRSTSASTNVRS